VDVSATADGGYDDLEFCVKNGANDTCGYTTANWLTTGTWYHVEAVFDGSLANADRLKLFVNNQKYALTPTNANPYPTTTGTMSGPTSIGGYATYYSNTIIDEVKVYHYARTPAQIAWDYNRGAPIAWYKFDECSSATAYNAALNANGQAAGMNGTIYPGDSSGNNDSVGSCNDGLSDPTNSMWNAGTTGKRNASLSFDGTNDYVEIADHNNLSFGDATNDFPVSVSAWVKTSDTTAEIVSKYDQTATELEYRLRMAGGILYFNLYDDSATSRIGRSVDFTPYQGTNWQHIIATYDGTRANSGVKIYINGNRVDTGDDSNGSYTAMENTAANLQIGHNAGGGSTTYLNGQADEIRIYNYALTELQIKTLYNESAVRFGPATGSP
jgi:hypothetical protein